MTDSPPRKVHIGEVVLSEPSRGSVSFGLPPDAPFGLPIFARSRYEALTRAFRAYVDFRQAQRASIDAEAAISGALEHKLAAEQRLAIAWRRHEHLHEILQADEARLLAELSRAFDAIKGARVEREERAVDEALERRVRRANLEADAIEAEARLEALRNPQAQVRDTVPKLTPAQKIACVRKEIEELRAAMIEMGGGEENLSPDDRAFLATIDLVREDKIRTIIENL